jgi:hypothetical protein
MACVAKHDPERGVPNEVQRKMVKLARKEAELSPRELAVTFTIEKAILYQRLRRIGY